MARGWRINPPPNWPTLPADWRPTDEWQPDPQWGPMPVGWTLWRRERRGAWLLRHRAALGLGAGAAVILGSALAGPAATELISAGGPSPAGPAASGPGIPGAQAPTPAGSAEVRADPQTEPQVEPPVRRPQSTPASRSRPRPSDAPTTDAVPTPSALPVLPVVPDAGEPVPQLRLGPAPAGTCAPGDERPDRRPDHDQRERDAPDGQSEVFFAAAGHTLGNEQEGPAGHHPEGDACPGPVPPTGVAPPG